MKISKEQVKAFFAHECTPREAALIRKYLEQNPGEAETYLPKSEWDNPDVQSLMPESFWSRQWAAIEQQRNRGIRIRRFTRITAAAAAVLLIAAGTALFLPADPPVQKKTANVSNIPRLKTIFNSSRITEQVSLPDGSTVALQPGSRISFLPDFNHTARDISLEGEALFSVARDKTRPFTVHSGNISTTALGTRFRVTFWGNKTAATVRLYEGRVVVRAADAQNQNSSYLQPGEELSYADNRITIVKFENNDRALKKEKEAVAQGPEVAGNPSKTAGTRRPGAADLPHWYRFDKESLPGVFDQLAALYNVRIDYDKKALQHKFFIGRFEQSSTIEAILKTIAELNGLEVEKTGEDHYRIK